MKSLLILAFAGLACSSQWFSPGQEYVYTYSGRILTGIPQIDSTFAGMGIQGKVVVQATSQDTYKMMMKNVQYGTFNEQLSGPEPKNWRNVEIGYGTPLTGQYQQYLESPVEFTTEQGQFKTVSVSSEEPQWSVNFKKALIASIKMQQPEQTYQSDSQQDSRRNPRFWYRHQQTSQDGDQYYWTTMEEGIEGKCENTYHVSELPEYMVTEYEHGMLKSERCQGKKYYQVMKTKDITKCEDRSLYLSSQGHKNCLIGNCESTNTKQSQTRYYGCGESADTMELHGMINEGELQHSVVAFNTETVVTGTKQILKLEEVKESQTEYPEISSPRTCHDLSYEFPKGPSYQSRQINSRQDQREILKEQSQTPETQTFYPYGDQETIDKEQLKSQMVEKLQQVASDISQVDHFAEKELASQLKTLTSLMSVMTTEDLKEMYQTIQSNTEYQETASTLYIELVRNSGTSPAVMFLKEMIEKDQISEIQKFLIVSTFTHYIKTPTEELIDQIFQLIKSDAITSKSYLKYPAHLVFSNLVSTACLHSTKTQKVYPEHVFGKMCSSNNPKISEYIPHFVQELQTAQTETEKQMALYVLGSTGHESVMPLIISYLQGSQDSQDQTSTSTRKAAMYSLLEHHRQNPQHRNHLLPVYLSVLHNPAESRQLRIAAILCVMEMQPTTVQLQKMAVSTWFEQDFEVGKYIYSSIKSYAQLSADSHPQYSSLYQLSQQCQTVLQLAKPLYHVFSVHQVSSGYLPELQIGATMISSLMKGITGTEVYHKTEYYLKQVQTVPMEFSGHVSGMNTIVKSMMKALQPSQSKSQLLNEILQQLEVSPRTDAQFEAGAWLRLSDDINFAVEINQGHIDVMKQKVLKAIKEQGFNVMQKICGKNPFNYNNVFEELPYQAVVPSDLGLPIIVESQMTYLVSLQGETNVECSISKPTAELELSKKLSYTYNGHAGTVCPFTQKMLTAGINIHRATNMPFTTKVELEPQSSKLTISMNPSSQVDSNTENIDVHHYHVKPYTTMKPSIYQDATPSILSPDTTYIHSQASPKTFQAEFGQSLGVDMKLKVKTECDLYDKKTMMDSWANYHYNPVAATWFFFTETALTAEGKPTARLHEYTLTHNPSQSTTKGAEMEVELSLSSKEKSQPTRKIKLTSSSPSQSHQVETKLEKCLNKLKSQYGYAFNAQVNCKLTGEETQTYSYSLTAGAGNDKDNMEHKWDLELHLQNQNKKVCMGGQMKYPTTPSSQAKFQYENKLGFGGSCEEYYINVEGKSQVSEQQRQKSQNSKESQKCQAKSQEEQQLKEQIKTIQDEEEKKKVEKKHAKVSLEKLNYCSKKTQQSRTVDYTEFDVTYSQELPQQVYDMAKTANTGLKAALFQYIYGISSPEQNQQQVKVQLYFNQEQNAVTMKVESPEDKTEYKNIRLPSELQGVVPFVAGQNPVEQSYKALTGENMLAKCTVGQGYVQTFDKKTYSYQIDECDHVTASDCSGDNDHAVMVLTKEIDGKKHITLLYGQYKIQVSPKQDNQEEYTITVNGEEQQIIKNKKISLTSDKKITAYYTEDKTVVISSPVSRFTHYGKTVEIEKSGPADGSHCGLCGDYNQDKRADLKSPKKCIFKSDSLFGQSYRSKSSQCSPLPQQTQQKIQEEEQKCTKYETKKTEVSSVYSSGQKDSYAIKKHSYIYQEDKICISQDPVVQCSSNSIPQSMKKKMIKYVCLPKGRISKLYSERIERGESPQELKHQPISFQAQMDVPVKCGQKQL